MENIPVGEEEKHSRRRKILEESCEKDDILDKVDESISRIVAINSAAEFNGGGSPNEKIVAEFSTIIPFDENSQKQLVKQFETYSSDEEKIEVLTKLAEDIYEKREEQLGKDMMRQIEKFVMLSAVDSLWMDHLDAIENLRGGIGLRGYGQRDPLVEYKNEAYKMFEQLITGIDDAIVHRIYKIQVQQAPQMPHQHRHVHMQAAGDTSISPSLQTKEVSQPARSSMPVAATPSVQNASSGDSSNRKKLGRNDPCWCGSGKKYKRCHYPN